MMHYRRIIFARSALVVALTGALAGCVTPAGSEAELGASVAIDLRLRDTPESAYRPVDKVVVPASHVIGDGMFPYEGIGWENGYVGYRLYLDGRLTSDAFGKQQSAPALAGVSSASRYHEIAPWGMDVLHVGPSLGMGGLGVIRDGQPRQFGQIGRIEAQIDEAGPERGVFTIRASGIAAGTGSNGAVASRYSIDRTSPLTRVSVRSSGDLPLAAGIVANANGQFLQSAPGSKGNWRYIATFGQQSENKDNLGIALFYRADQARYGGMANETHFVAFDGAAIEYAFLAAWERDAGGIKTSIAFAAMLDRELARLQTGTEEGQ